MRNKSAIYSNQRDKLGMPNSVRHGVYEDNSTGSCQTVCIAITISSRDIPNKKVKDICELTNSGGGTVRTKRLGQLWHRQLSNK